MTDLVVIFKDMIEAQNKAQELRLGGQDYRFERLRGEKLEALFNEKMKVLARDQQIDVILNLVLDGFLPPFLLQAMVELNGTWGSIGTDHHKIALSVLENIEAGIPLKDVLDFSSNAIKHMGVSWDDFYAIMKEIRNIIHFH